MTTACVNCEAPKENSTSRINDTQHKLPHGPLTVDELRELTYLCTVARAEWQQALVLHLQARKAVVAQQAAWQQQQRQARQQQQQQQQSSSSKSKLQQHQQQQQHLRRDSIYSMDSFVVDVPEPYERPG